MKYNHSGRCAWLQIGVHSVQSRVLVEHHAGQGESSTRPKIDILKLKKESECNALSIPCLLSRSTKSHIFSPLLTFPVFDMA